MIKTHFIAGHDFENFFLRICHVFYHFKLALKYDTRQMFKNDYASFLGIIGCHDPKTVNTPIFFLIFVEFTLKKKE